MWTIADDMIGEADLLGVRASALPVNEREKIRRDLAEKYGRSKAGWPLWDGPSDDPSLQEEAAWRLVADFVGDSACIVLWERRTEEQALQFERGRDLVRVLEGVHRTEFYVTDHITSFLLCFNDHDCLVAAGRAAPWLRTHLVTRDSKPPG